jgi:hypothetical protein
MLTPEEIDILKERYAKYNEMCDLYNENEKFKRFVDRACAMYDLHRDICLLHKTVQEVGYYYKNEDVDPLKKEIYVDVVEKFAEDKAC